MSRGKSIARSRRAGSFVAVTAAVVAVPAAIALAQDAAPAGNPAPASGVVQLPEVNVQAGIERGYSPVPGFVAGVSTAGTKTDTPIIETPQSISVVTADEIAARNARNLNQVLRYTPGVVTETRGASAVRLDQMTIRGYSPTQYLDGMRLAGGRDANPSLDAYRLERVEVLRGPASVLYGNSPPGGIINAVSKRPTTERIREVLLEAGNRSRYRAAGDFSGQLDEDGQWLGRFIGSYSEGDGELDETRERRYFFSPSLTWRPTGDTTITFLGHYQRDPDGGSYGGVPAWGSALPNPNGRIGMRFYDGDRGFEKLDREHYQIGYLAEHRLNSVFTLRQNFRYMHTQGEYRSLYGSAITNDRQNLIRSVYGTDADFDVFTLDNQVQARFDTGPVQHTVLAGLDYYRLLSDTYTGQNVYNGRPNGVPLQNLFNPVYANQGAVWPGFSSFSSQRQNQTGVYLQDQLKLGQLVVLLGGRMDWSDSTTENRSAGNFRLTSTSRTTDHALTGRAGAVYLFENGIAPYVSYSESFEPQSGTDRNFNQFDPTTGRQYEVGVRYQPPGTNLSLAVAAFDLLRQNVLSTDPADPRYNIQSGEVRTRGFELEAKASLMDGLSLTAAYTYLDMEYTKSNNTVSIDYSIQDRESGGTRPQEGRAPTGIPRHNASAWLDYTVPGSGTFQGLSVAGGVRYLGSSWGDAANTFKVDSATLFDAAIRYDLSHFGRNFEGMQAAVNINNIADTRYVSSCLGYAWCYYGYGRTITGSLRYRF